MPFILMTDGAREVPNVPPCRRHADIRLRAVAARCPRAMRSGSTCRRRERARRAGRHAVLPRLMMICAAKEILARGEMMPRCGVRCTP